MKVILGKPIVGESAMDDVETTDISPIVSAILIAECKDEPLVWCHICKIEDHFTDDCQDDNEGKAHLV